MKKIFLLLTALVVTVSLAACGGAAEESTTATGYGLTYGNYVGVAHITVSPEGVVEALELDEYFLPYSWAKVSEDHAENDDVLEVVGARSTDYYAMYVQIGDKLFTGEVTESGIVYSSEGIEDLNAWLADEANAKWYVEQVDAGAYYIANEDGTESDYEMVDASASVSLIKSETSYWAAGGRGLGWLANRDFTVESIIGLDLSEDLDIDTNEDDEWTINDTTTGATWTAFEDYLEVIVRAYNSATE